MSELPGQDADREGFLSRTISITGRVGAGIVVVSYAALIVDGVKVIGSQLFDSYAAVMEHPDFIDYAFTGLVGGLAVVGSVAGAQAVREHIVDRRQKE